MADVDITSLSVQIEADTAGAEININKLATALSSLEKKANLTKSIGNIEKLSKSIDALKTASNGIGSVDKISNFIDGINSLDASAGKNAINSLSRSISSLAKSTVTLNGTDFSGLGDEFKSLTSAIKPFEDMDVSAAKDAGSALQKLSNGITGINSADFYALGDGVRQLMNALAPLSILNIDGLKNIGSAFNAMGKIPDLTAKLDTATLDSFADACDRISTALTPLATQLQNVGNAFNQLPAKLKQVVTATNKVTAATQKAKSGYKGLSSQLAGFASVMKSVVSFSALVKVTSSAIKSFNEYYEAANFFGVAMKDLTGEASDFIDKMNELLGIDPTEAMNNMSTIQSLATSFGIASDKAYVLSKNLTQLSYDFSSLKDSSVTEAFTKMQAAISGELEPIRRWGVDLSQARLQQELLDLGFQQNISTLSQADKAILRYIAIMKQTTDAQGDFAKTIDSPANQIKILKAQVEGLARAVGSVLYPALSTVLPIAIATVEVIKEAVQSLAALIGVKVEFSDYSSIGDSSSALDSVTESAEEAKNALKSYSVGIDELNVINPNDTASGSGSGSTGNILGDVDLSKYEYDMFAEYVGNSVDEIKEKIKDILPIVEAIGISIAAWKLTDFLLNLGEMITKLTTANDKAALLNSTLLGIGLVVIGATLEFVGIRDALKKGIDDANLSEMISGALLSVGGGAILAKVLPNWVTDNAVMNAINVSGEQMGKSLVGACVAGVIAGIPMFVVGVVDALENGISETNTKTLAFSGGLIGAGIGGLIGGVPGAIIGALVGIAGGLITEICLGIAQYWDEIVAEVKRLWDDFNQKVNESFTGFLQSIKDWLDGIREKIDEKIEPFASAMGKLLNAFSAENVERVVSDWGAKLKEGFDSAVEKAKEIINENTLLSAGKDLIQGLIDGVNEMIKSVVDTVGGVAESIITKAKNVLGIHSPSKVFAEIGNFLAQGLANGIEEGRGYVQNALNVLVEDVTAVGQEFIDSSTNTAWGYVDRFVNTLDSEWQRIDNALKTDFFGSMNTLWDAISNGDLETLGKWAASYFYHAMDEEQKQQIINIAKNSLSQLNSALSGVWQNIAGMAASYVGQLVPSLGLATTAQTGLNVAMDANPIMLVISLIGMLVGALVNFAGTNSSVANSFSKVWDGVYNVVSYVFEGIVRVFGVFIQGFVNMINVLIGAYNLVAKLWGDHMNYVSNPVFDFADKIAQARNDRKNNSGNVDVNSPSSDYPKYDGSSDYPGYDDDYSKYPGTSDWDSSHGGTTGGYTSSGNVTVDFNEAEMRDSVYNGTYNAFLDIFQRYGDELTGGQELKIYLDGKQLTASIEKRQNERGQSLMGNEVYAY